MRGRSVMSVGSAGSRPCRSSHNRSLCPSMRGAARRRSSTAVGCYRAGPIDRQPDPERSSLRDSRPGNRQGFRAVPFLCEERAGRACGHEPAWRAGTPVPVPEGARSPGIRRRRSPGSRVPPRRPFMSNSAAGASASASSWRPTMPSLDDHFNALTKVRPPDGWPDLRERGTRPIAPRPRHGLRAGTAVLAFVVAAAGFAFAIRAFRMERTETPSWAVHSGLIAFARGGPQSGLFVTNPDGTGLTKLPSVPGDTDPAWSPDGSKIAFVRFREGGAGIWVMNADGTGARRITDGGLDVDGTDLGPAWSPDGSRIAFAREGRPAKAATGNTDIYVVNADGTDAVRLTDDPMMEYAPTWSPDGSRIAFAAYDLAAGGNP